MPPTVVEPSNLNERNRDTTRPSEFLQVNSSFDLQGSLPQVILDYTQLTTKTNYSPHRGMGVHNDFILREERKTEAPIIYLLGLPSTQTQSRQSRLTQ